MPIYELECTRCGKKEEKLYTCIINFLTPAEIKKRDRQRKIELQKQAIPGYEIIDTAPLTGPKELMPKCGSCGAPQILLPSLTSMQPDKYWAGRVIHGKYVTSKKEVSRDIEPATRDKMEWVAKQREKRVQEHNDKSRRKLKQFLTNQLAGVTIDPDGGSAKERESYERARGRSYTGTTED